MGEPFILIAISAFYCTRDTFYITRQWKNVDEESWPMHDTKFSFFNFILKYCWNRCFMAKMFHLFATLTIEKSFQHSNIKPVSLCSHLIFFKLLKTCWRKQQSHCLVTVYEYLQKGPLCIFQLFQLVCWKVLQMTKTVESIRDSFYYLLKTKHFQTCWEETSIFTVFTAAWIAQWVKHESATQRVYVRILARPD